MKRRISTILSFVCFFMFFSCDDSGGEKGEPIITMDLSAQHPKTRDVDIIFLIDSSASMADEQALLQQNIQSFISVFRDGPGGMLNLHIGVITPDLGTYPYNIPGCETPGGDQGRFLKGVNNACTNPVNQKYVVDVEPRGCTIEKTRILGEATTCSDHDCAQSHCNVAAFTGLDGVATEPSGLVFAEDENGCPRCRNYTGATLEEVFQCMVSVGTNGCGMEQQLEAVKQALTGGQTDNIGFLRDSAYMAVFIISDEDDCSVKQAELFYPQGDINSTLGPLTSFRCTEFGVVCDQPWQREMPQGQLTYSNCAPREDNDPKNMLYPISTYTNTLSMLKDSSIIIVGAITGPYTNQITVGLDYNLNPKMQPSCGNTGDGGDPGVRIKAFVSEFLKEEADMQWAFTSICSTDYSPALDGFANALVSSTSYECMPFPLEGCPDPAFSNGGPKLTDLSDFEASLCYPMCEVQDIDFDGNVRDIPHCSKEYEDGHPAVRDSNLPVPACYHIGYRPDCAIPCPPGSSELGCHPTNNPWFAPSRGADMIISRRENPPVGTRLKVVCQAGKLNEDLCFDGLDNDDDGNIDMNDPDCQYQ